MSECTKHSAADVLRELPPCPLCEVEARDKRIAELEAALAQDDDNSGIVAPQRPRKKLFDSESLVREARRQALEEAADFVREFTLDRPPEWWTYESAMDAAKIAHGVLADELRRMAKEARDG